MISLINCILVADYFNSDFKFEWTEKEPGLFHVIPAKEEIFAPDFYEHHCLDSDQVQNVVNLETFLISIYGPQRIGDPTLLYVEVNGLTDTDLIRDIVGPSEYDGLLKKAYERVEYGAKAAECIALAKSVPLEPGAVAIHLRAGDVIYSSAIRYQASVGKKAVPYQVAVALIRQLRSEGKPVLLFGQDKALCRSLAAAFDGAFADDLGVSQHEHSFFAELFDVTLMSRCSDVWGGQSFFLRLAAATMGHSVSEIYDFFGSDHRKDLILSTDIPEAVEAAASVEQKVYSLWSVAADIYHQPEFDLAAYSKATDEILRISPGDRFVSFASACANARGGNYDEAERILKDLVDRFGKKAVTVLRQTRLPISEYVYQLWPAAEANHPWSATFLISFDNSLPKTPFYLKKLLSNEEVTHSALSNRLKMELRTIKRRRKLPVANGETKPLALEAKDLPESLMKLKPKQRRRVLRDKRAVMEKMTSDRLMKKLADIETRLKSTEEKYAKSRRQIKALNKKLAVAESRLTKAGQELELANRKITDNAEKLKVNEKKLLETKKSLQKAHQRNQAITSSLAWKVTRPLRWASKVMPINKKPAKTKGPGHKA
jgi:hypothetical protein